MDREKAFAAALQELVEMGRRQGNVLSQGQVSGAFQGMLLEERQLELVRGYLKENKIGVDAAVNPDDYLTDEDVSYLDLYLEELKELKKVYGDVGKEEVILAAMAGGKEAGEKLILLFLPQVVEIAKLYAGQGVLLEDLIGEGNVALTLGSALIVCAESVEEAEGLLGKGIMDAMEELIRESHAAGQADRKILDRLQQISDLAGRMCEDAGRKVSVEELAQESGFDRAEILEALEALEVMGGRIGGIEPTA